MSIRSTRDRDGADNATTGGVAPTHAAVSPAVVQTNGTNADSPVSSLDVANSIGNSCRVGPVSNHFATESQGNKGETIDANSTSGTQKTKRSGGRRKASTTIPKEKGAGRIRKSRTRNSNTKAEPARSSARAVRSGGRKAKGSASPEGSNTTNASSDQRHSEGEKSAAQDRRRSKRGKADSVAPTWARATASRKVSEVKDPITQSK